MAENQTLLPPTRAAANSLSSSTTSVWTMRRAGALPSVRSGQSVGVSAAALHAWIARHEQKAG